MSFVYQYMVSLGNSLSIRGLPSLFVNYFMWEISSANREIVTAGKINNSVSNLDNKTNKCINFKIIFFYTQFIITPICFDLSGLSSEHQQRIYI